MPGAEIVAGGQYTNLKHLPVMDRHPSVVAVIRGDGERPLPMTLDAMAKGGDLCGIPNLVWRDGHRIRINPIEYIDIEAFPSPSIIGTSKIVPYESMRGCPFDCKFCSFPVTSPKWRYKSAEKIRDDWSAHVEINGAEVNSATDSTFMISPTRLRRLPEIPPDSDVPQSDGFSRANTPVSARQLLGYPGETPEMYGETVDYLVDEFAGQFYVNMFSVADENMPLWADREEWQSVSADPTDTLAPWSHIGMDGAEAERLQKETLDKVRAAGETAVTHAWQDEFQSRLLSWHDLRTNLAVEQSIERLGMAPLDYADLDEGAHAMGTQVDRLSDLGVELAPYARELCREAI